MMPVGLRMAVEGASPPSAQTMKAEAPIAPISQRLFDRSPRCSANLLTQPALRLFARLDFLVVFEGCSGRAVHLEAGEEAEIRSLWARFP